MNNDIFSLIDAAKEQMKQIGLADATIETYQQRSFNQIIQRYQKEGDYQYRQELSLIHIFNHSVIIITLLEFSHARNDPVTDNNIQGLIHT